MMTPKNPNKLPEAVLALFVEAHNRRTGGGDVGSRRSVEDAWVGLGMPSTYKPGVQAGYFRPLHDQETPRTNNWYLFTQDGIAVYQELYGDQAVLSPYEGPSSGRFELAPH